MSALNVTALAQKLDLFLLRPDITDADLAKLCWEAKQYHLGAITVPSAAVKFCAEQLAGSDTQICAAIGFPLGQSSVAAKAFEGSQAIHDGATTVDFFLNLGNVKSGRMCDVVNELTTLVKASQDHPVKITLETCYLTDQEKKALCEAAIQSGATLVKTSTGLAQGATLPDVLLLISIAQGEIQVEAAGEIRTLDQALAFLDAGAAYIGTKEAIAILQEAEEVLPA